MTANTTTTVTEETTVTTTTSAAPAEKKLTKKEQAAAQLAAFRTAMLARLGTDDKTGLKYTPGEVSDYEANLPEGLTAEIRKQVHNYDSFFVAGTTGAALTKAAEAFEANKDLTTVTVAVPMFGKDNVQIIANRNGTASVAVVTTVANPRAGDLKAAFDEFDAAMAVEETTA